MCPVRAESDPLKLKLNKGPFVIFGPRVLADLEQFNGPETFGPRGSPGEYTLRLKYFENEAQNARGPRNGVRLTVARNTPAGNGRPGAKRRGCSGFVLLSLWLFSLLFGSKGPCARDPSDGRRSGRGGGGVCRRGVNARGVDDGVGQVAWSEGRGATTTTTTTAATAVGGQVFGFNRHRTSRPSVCTRNRHAVDVHVVVVLVVVVRRLCVRRCRRSDGGVPADVPVGKSVGGRALSRR